jgi:hypothetical protein
VDYQQLIGLGKGIADSMIIIWPDRQIKKIDRPAINQVHIVAENDGGPAHVRAPVLTETLLQLNTDNFFDKHKEDDFIDFYSERNIPAMLSHEGPHADTADVNGDGFTDIYIGGAGGQPGQLYWQTSSGFIKKYLKAFESDKDFEDVAVLFFDADKDGDKDLFVGAGGNVQPPGSKLLLHRLYLNDGSGNFTLSENAFPANSANIAVAAADDVDADGDMDIFTGSRSLPQNYGVPPASNLYINDGRGKFTLTDSIKAGMITGAAFTDITGDEKKELVIAGEWMPPQFFSVDKGKLQQLSTNLSGLKGWWQSMTVADLNNDGKNDLVLGNIGSNCYIKPDAANPVKLWVNDFDQNGTLDKIITRTVNGKDVPIFLKRELTEQMPSLKKQNLRFEQYAHKTIQDLFPKGALSKAAVYEFNYPLSCIAYSKGNGQFDVQPLPLYAQLSCINAALPADVNGDNKTDLVLAGNQFYLQPQFARLDASYGNVLINTGNNQWRVALPAESGLEVRGEVRDLKYISTPAGGQLFVLQNDYYPLLYRLKKVKQPGAK